MTDILDPQNTTTPVVDPVNPQAPVVAPTPASPVTVIEVATGGTTINTVVRAPAVITAEHNPVQVIEVSGIPIKQGVGEEVTTALLEHIASRNPHPAYDDLPSLTLLFENGII